ncbi:MAG: RagB/SusD family nutrient uptake outer membrane protein [Segetibacter sp.]|nr:RagB/SusD family nutrient uptake outer membrane protein [Segetibacter sp.]
MNQYKKLKRFALPLLTVVSMASCTKLNESLNSTLTNAEVANTPGSTAGLVAAAYSDLGGLLHSQSQVFALQENTTDEALVPTRGGDWDDNGVWRVLHSHTWNADHQYVLDVFNNLNKLSFDATNVLFFKPTAAEIAEARFLRAFALYNLLDLYGQYPLREPGENLLNAPVVKTAAEGISFIISELNAILPTLPATNPVFKATPDAARVLLMKCYLNKGAFLNRAVPTFDAADMQQVITLGNAIITGGKYSFTTNYFDNFSVDNDAKSKEGIFTYMNTPKVAANNGGPQARWNMTLHYNSYTPANPNAGWNGFTTISDFYSSFNVSGTPTAFGPSDTVFDRRLGGRFYAGATDISGLRPGFLVNQQYNEAGVALKDRKGAPLAYTPAIASNMIETGANLEVTGIRVVKYVPDYANYGGPAGNDLMIFRYPDAFLMVAEARRRTGDDAGALAMVNQLRSVRGAAPLTSLPLVNPNNVEDPNTLLAERGREMYWESVRRTDLIRFGVFLKPWQYKPSDDPKNLLFPIPNQALASNPNLKQNPGY